MSGASRRNCFDRQDKELDRRVKELERLRRLVRDLELEARGRRRRRDHDERGEGSASIGGCNGAGSHQSRPHRHQDRSQEYAERDSISPNERQPRNAAMDAMSHALHQAAWSPFLREIERAPMPSRFT